MKTKHFFQVLFITMTLIFNSCSSSDSDGDNGNPITSITLSKVSPSSVFAGDMVTFKVLANNGDDVTANTTISLNGNSINGNTYTTTNDGTLDFTATYNNLTSNLQVTVNQVVQISSITLSQTSNNDVFEGDTITFEVIADTNQNVTSTASITLNGNSINGNTYQTTASGMLEFVATYENLTSNTLQVNVLDAPTVFSKNVLVEDYTGTWCQYCPRVSYAIEQVKTQTDKLVVVAVHNDNEFYCNEVDALETAFGISGYPTAKVNRSASWTFPEPENVAQIVNLTGNDANVGVAMTPTLNGSQMTIEVSVKFGGGFTSSNTKLGVFILEDDLIADQVNSTSYYGGSNPISGFEHDHVLRSSLTNVIGDAIPDGDIVTDAVYTRTFTVAVPSNVTDTSKMSVVAFVANDDFLGNSYAVNSRVAHFGDTQSFEEQ